MPTTNIHNHLHWHTVNAKGEDTLVIFIKNRTKETVTVRALPMNGKGKVFYTGAIQEIELNLGELMASWDLERFEISANLPVDYKTCRLWRVMQSTSFELKDDGDMCWYEAIGHHAKILGWTFSVKGPKTITPETAKAKFWVKWNKTYPGLHLQYPTVTPEEVSTSLVW